MEESAPVFLVDLHAPVTTEENIPPSQGVDENIPADDVAEDPSSSEGNPAKSFEHEEHTTTEDEQPPVPVKQSAPIPRWIGVLFTVLVLVILALIAAWYYTSTATSSSSAANAALVAQEYLDALKEHNPTRPQQLATEASRAVLPPLWYTIAAGQATGDAEVMEGETAQIPVEISLMRPAQANLPKLRLDDAIYRTYRIALPLKREHGEWRVDQRQAFQLLRKEIQTENPGVALPSH